MFFYNKKTKREMVLSNEKLRSKVMKNKLQKKNYFMLAAIIRGKKRPIVCIYVFLDIILIDIFLKNVYIITICLIIFGNGIVNR